MKEIMRSAQDAKSYLNTFLPDTPSVILRSKDKCEKKLAKIANDLTAETKTGITQFLAQSRQNIYMNLIPLFSGSHAIKEASLLDPEARKLHTMQYYKYSLENNNLLARIFSESLRSFEQGSKSDLSWIPECREKLEEQDRELLKQRTQVTAMARVGFIPDRSPVEADTPLMLNPSCNETVSLLPPR